MTDKVINLDDRRPHKAVYAACMTCGKDWVEAAPVGTHTFECPVCKTLTGTQVKPMDHEFLSKFMFEAKTKEDREHRILVVLNANNMRIQGLL